MQARSQDFQKGVTNLVAFYAWRPGGTTPLRIFKRGNSYDL